MLKNVEVATRPISFRLPEELAKILDKHLQDADLELAPWMREVIAQALDHPEMSDSYKLAREAERLRRKVHREREMDHGKDHTTKKKRTT